MGYEAEDFPAFGCVFHAVQLIEGLGQFKDDQGAEMAGDVFVFVAELLDVVEQVLPLGAVGVTGGPFCVAAMAPFGEILLPDGIAIEQFGHDFLDFGQAVEPRDEVNAASAVVEATI